MCVYMHVCGMCIYTYRDTRAFECLGQLFCVAVCCSVYIYTQRDIHPFECLGQPFRVAVCCSVLQYAYIHIKRHARV